MLSYISDGWYGANKLLGKYVQIRPNIVYLKPAESTSDQLSCNRQIPDSSPDSECGAGEEQTLEINGATMKNMLSKNLYIHDMAEKIFFKHCT